jgi:hypothetical protein
LHNAAHDVCEKFLAFVNSASMRDLARNTSAVWLLLLCAACGVLRAQTAPPSVPLLIRYTGSGDGVTSGMAGVTFALYKDQSGGAALWLETQSVALDSHGQFQTLIGASHNDGIPLELFTSGEARWLGVQVENQPEQPRIMLVSVPYALKAADASTLGGLPPSAFALAVPDATAKIFSTSQNIVSAEVVAPQPNLTVNSAAANYVPLFTSTAGDLTSSSIYQAANGAIGINTSAPASWFHVASYLPGIATFQRIGGARFTFQNYLDNDASGAGSIFFVTDSTAKQYQPLKFDALTLQIRPNGDPANSFYVDSSGKVGFGTTSPTDRLTVNGNVALLSGGVFKFADGSMQSTAAASGISASSPDGSIAIGGTATAPTIVVATSGITDTKVHDVSAAKITGQLTDVQLASISSAKITGQVADAQIAGVSASKVTGTLALAQIAAGNALPLAEESLRLLRTRCTGTSGTLSCSNPSFTAVKMSTGSYQLTMVNPFASSDIPVVTVSAIGASTAPSNWCSVSSASYQSFSVACFNLTGPADVDFNLIVLGAR